MPLKRSNRRLFAALTILFAFAFVVAACSGADESGVAEQAGSDGGGFSDVADEFVETTIAAPTTTVAAAARKDQPAALGSGGVTAALQPADLGRDIIFTADLTIAVTDVAAAGQEATRIIESMGGFLFGQQTTGDPTPQTVLTFKVLPEDFQEALSRLGSLGELRTQSVTADDVTERIVDLQSRINTSEASVQRLREFLAEADSVEAVAALENQLLERESQLETMRGQLRTLERQVSLATIVVRLTEAAARPDLRLTVSAYPGDDDGFSCPADGGTGVDRGTPATLCFEVTNVGDTNLTGFALRDPVLDITIDDTTVVFGDPTLVMEPGQSFVLSYVVEPERSLRTQTTVTATPIDADGQEVGNRTVAATESVFIEARDPGGIPTFTDGLRASWDLLVRLAQLAVLAAGSLIPFVWIPLLLWWLWRRRRTRTQAAPTAPVSTPEPVPAAPAKPNEDGPTKDE